MTRSSNGAARRRTGYSLLATVPVLFTTIALLIAGESAAFAQVAPTLGSAGTFAVLGASTVTNTGDTVLDGNLGLSPGTSVTGFPPGTITAPFQEFPPNGTVAQQAQTDLTAAYNQAEAEPATTTGVTSIGTETLTPGVYNSDSSMDITGTLTLNAQGNPDAAFIFQAGSTLTAENGITVDLINDAQPGCVFWQVGSSATLGTGVTFTGNVLALASITVNTGDTVDGSMLASNGAVTLADDDITAPPTCSVPVPLASPIAAVPAGIAGLSFLGWFLVRRRRTVASGHLELES
jgi:ice-binding like protein